jgi:hypothetical protein
MVEDHLQNLGYTLEDFEVDFFNGEGGQNTYSCLPASGWEKSNNQVLTKSGKIMFIFTDGHPVKEIFIGHLYLSGARATLYAVGERLPR